MNTLANNVQIYSFLEKFAKSIPLLLELIMCEHEAINKYNYCIFSTDYDNAFLMKVLISYMLHVVLSIDSITLNKKSHKSSTFFLHFSL